MSRNGKQVGFNRHVKLRWMQYTARLAMAGKSRTEINEALQGYLEDKLSGGNAGHRGSREKAITILMRIWCGGRNSPDQLRAEAFRLMESQSDSDKLALHWGMTMAVYPFFTLVTGTVGRLLRLQDNVSTRQVLRRMYEQHGDRESVKRATQRFMQTLEDWRVLEQDGGSKTYHPAPPISITDTALAKWLAEALVVGNATEAMDLETINGNTALFPFDMLNLSPAILEESPRLQVIRHGLDQALVKRVATKKLGTTEFH